jgi:ATP-dependent Clp protease adapter protein ClpS
VAGPAVAPRPTLLPDAVEAQTWRIVLFNDDVTPFDVVVLGLQQVLGLSDEVAEMVAGEAHRSGSAVARRGLAEAVAHRLCARLTAATRVPHLCPGVQCEAQADD